MTHHAPQIAIASPNLLVALGFKTILEKIIPTATIDIHSTIDELLAYNPSSYSHLFVAYPLYANYREHLADDRRTIVLVESSLQTLPPNTLSIHIHQGEEALVKEILRLRHRAHIASHAIDNYPNPHTQTLPAPLTEREIEVLSYIAQGYINKEIADLMDISITTVITHRKNIVNKLGIKSVAGLTIYSIANGYVDPHTIVQ